MSVDTYFLVGVVVFMLNLVIFAWVAASETKVEEVMSTIMMGFLFSLLVGIMWIPSLLVIVSFFIFKWIRKMM